MKIERIQTGNCEFGFYDYKKMSTSPNLQRLEHIDSDYEIFYPKEYGITLIKLDGHEFESRVFIYYVPEDKKFYHETIITISFKNEKKFDTVYDLADYYKPKIAKEIIKEIQQGSLRKVIKNQLDFLEIMKSTNKSIE